MKKLQIIDLIRSFAVLAVLAVHSSNYVRPLSSPVLGDLFFHFQRNGPYGVYLFFLVSGFLITGIVDQSPGGLFRPNLRSFYFRRIGRIFPLLFFCILLAFAAWEALPQDALRVSLCFGIPDKTPWVFFVLSLLTFTFNFFYIAGPWGSVMGQFWRLLWTLSIEEQFYLFFPITLKKIGGERRLIFLLSCLIAGGLFWRTAVHFLVPSNNLVKFCASPGTFDQIGFGVLLYLVWRRYRPFFQTHPGWSLSLCLAGLALVGGCYYFTFCNDLVDQIYAMTLLGIGLFTFILGGLHLPVFESRFLAPLALPGKYCYGMYLWHPFMMFLLGTNLPKWRNGFLAYLFFCGSTLLVAMISYHYFELPANRWIRRLGEHRTA